MEGSHLRFTRPVAHRVFVPDPRSTTVETFSIPALDCPDELALIERALSKESGVGRLAPNYVQRTLRVEFDTQICTSEQIG